MTKYTYYTDGASTMKKENGEYLKGAGGWAFIELTDDIPTNQMYGCAVKTTNNEQELYAIFAALHHFLTKGKKGSEVEICSDSAYCVNIFNSWITGWENNGWTRGKKHEPIENLELIQRIWKLVNEINRRFSKITFVKVIGHSGDKYNDAADKLAVEGKRMAQEMNINKGYGGFEEPLFETE